MDTLNYLLVANFEAKTTTKNVTISTETGTEKLQLSIDKNLMLSCLEIIVDNAIDNSPDQSQVLIKCYEETDRKQRISFEVLDNGTGFSRLALNQLFEFFTADDIDFHSEGFGLGLATAKLIMDTLSGEIKIANRESGGASVKISFNK